MRKKAIKVLNWYVNQVLPLEVIRGLLRLLHSCTHMNSNFMIVLFLWCFSPSLSITSASSDHSSSHPVVTSNHSSSSTSASHLFTVFPCCSLSSLLQLASSSSPVGPCCPSLLLYLLHVTFHPLLPYSSHSCTFPFLLLLLFILLSSAFSSPPPLNLSPPSSSFILSSLHPFSLFLPPLFLWAALVVWTS